MEHTEGRKEHGHHSWTCFFNIFGLSAFSVVKTAVVTLFLLSCLFSFHKYNRDDKGKHFVEFFCTLYISLQSRTLSFTLKQAGTLQVLEHFEMLC